MAMFNLVFNGKSFPVPKKSLFDLFEHHQELFPATSYAVQSSVPVGLFELFVTSLKTQTKISVTKGNAASLSLLAREFFLPELAAECAAFSKPVDPMSTLSDRVGQLELRVSSFAKPPGKIEEKIESQERDLEHLRQEVEKQRESVDGKVAVVISRVDELLREFEKLRGEVRAVKDSVGGEIGKLKSETAKVAKSVSGLETLRGEFGDLKVSVDRLQQDFTRVGNPKPADSSSEGDKATNPKPVPSVQKQPAQRPPPSPNPPVRPQPTSKPSPSVSSKPEKSQSKVEIPMKSSQSLDGIISYLTKKHGGNVQENGIVAITASSASSGDPDYDLRSMADLDCASYFASKNEPGQWVCWDFRAMRVRPTHYAIRAWHPKSWVVEGLLDGSKWTAIDRKTDNQNFKNNWTVASFAVSKPAEFRFLRLTQTGRSHTGNDALLLSAVEFFGTLFE
jgi:hypothetical protein